MDIAVTAPSNRKRAALLFDKVFIPWGSENGKSDAPEEISFYDKKYDMAVMMAVKTTSGFLDPQVIERYFYPSPYNAISYGESQGDELYSNIIKNVWGYSKEANITLVPIFSSEQSLHDDIPLEADNGTILKATFNNLPILDESKISWEQVIEFKEDKESLNKYRDFRIWMRKNDQIGSLQQAEDIIGRLLDDYEWALKKHGLSTVIGSLSTLTSSKTLTKVASVGGVATYFSEPLLGILASGILLASEVTIQVGKYKLEKEDIVRSNIPDIAIVYDIRKMLKNA
ncbi:MAG: hypothetical protein D3904_00100 [Candidatus Electrothrix sp. EH2]|nr:hypothetical protein [Candidatus Electrothrix sp. EH2]